MTEKESKGTWEPRIAKLEIQVGDKVEQIPVFRLSYKKEDIYAGYVDAFPHHGVLVFQTTRRDYPEPGYTGKPADIVRETERFGWGKPPKIEEIYNDIQKASEIAKSDGIKKFLEYCKELENNWTAHLQ